jgi:hypothetical protein
MDDDFCRERAKTVRELAEKADPFIRKRLLELAQHYERRLAISPKAETDEKRRQSAASAGDRFNADDAKTPPRSG